MASVDIILEKFVPALGKKGNRGLAICGFIADCCDGCSEDDVGVGAAAGEPIKLELYSGVGG